MTVKELSQLYYLRQEIAMDERRLSDLRSTSDSPSLSGMPHKPGYTNRLEQTVGAIVDLERTIREKRARCIRERAWLESYIATVPDSRLRQILTLRFSDGEPWHTIACRMGGGNTEDSVKKMCYRFLENDKI